MAKQQKRKSILDSVRRNMPIGQNDKESWKLYCNFIDAFNETLNEVKVSVSPILYQEHMKTTRETQEGVTDPVFRKKLEDEKKRVIVNRKGTISFLGISEAASAMDEAYQRMRDAPKTDQTSEFSQRYTIITHRLTEVANAVWSGKGLDAASRNLVASLYIKEAPLNITQGKQDARLAAEALAVHAATIKNKILGIGR
ncbi:MAG: hypothetical protein ACOYNL_08115 [Rickettsiales bacterium]